MLKRGDSYRLAIWQAVAQRVVQQPWRGEGVLTDDSVDVPARPPQKGEYRIEHPHNIFLATTLYGGLPALALLLSVLLFAGQAGCAWPGQADPSGCWCCCSACCAC